MSKSLQDSTQQAFVQLGSYITAWLDGSLTDDAFDAAVETAERRNAWFTHQNIRFALQGIASQLDSQVLSQWLKQYPQTDKPRTIGVVMAGNIPLVGFHDMLCVLLSGNKYLGKLSGKDESLLQFVAQKLISFEPELAQRITFTQAIIRDFDAIIATGSNNSARYFDYYFSRYPHIIRRNRTSVAVLDGSESEQDLALLARDIFMYFGLGCRNVSKLYLPAHYPIEQLCSQFAKHADLGNHSKFANNYDYNKSLYLLNKTAFYDTGFCMLKEDENLFSPISVLYFETYTDLAAVQLKLNAQAEQIQCIVSRLGGFYKPSLAYGQAQLPRVDDYADDVDTLKFLTYLN